MKMKAMGNGAVFAAVLALGCGSAAAQKPQYGGTLEVGNVFVTLAALSFDSQDWPWKLNHDTGMYYEQLLAGDLDKSPRRLPGYFDHIVKGEARDKHTVVFSFKEYSAEWDYRFGWGYYSAIVPKEMGAVDAKNWKNGVGTGPFQIIDHVQGNSITYAKNPQY